MNYLTLEQTRFYSFYFCYIKYHIYCGHCLHCSYLFPFTSQPTRKIVFNFQYEMASYFYIFLFCFVFLFFLNYRSFLSFFISQKWRSRYSIKCGQVQGSFSTSLACRGNPLERERKIHWLPWIAVIGRVVPDFISTFWAPSLFYKFYIRWGKVTQNNLQLA